jgi:ketosteroid isomerase-like protein
MMIRRSRRRGRLNSAGMVVQEVAMKIVVLVASIVLAPAALSAQRASSGLSGELEALHAKWLAAFEAGDGAAMDQMEVDDLALVMHTGMVWTKAGPRAGKQPKREPPTQHVLSDAAVRQFGDSAILTGTVTSTTGSDVSKVGTTIVFVKREGKWLIASAQWSPIVAAK